MKNTAAFILALLILFFVSACSASDASANGTDTSVSAGETAEPDPFAGCDFGGRQFRILTSIDAMNATNANELIEGSGSLNGEAVNDAVWERNNYVEEFLNIDLVFTQQSSTYGTATTDHRIIVMSGDDA